MCLSIQIKLQYYIFSIYTLWKILISCSCFLDLTWIIYDTKQQNVGISALLVTSFGTLWMFYLWFCDIYYYYHLDNIIVWIRFRDQQKITPRNSRNSNNNTMKRLYKHPSLPRVTCWQNLDKILWIIWMMWNIYIQRNIYIIIPGYLLTNICRSCLTQVMEKRLNFPIRIFVVLHGNHLYLHGMILSKIFHKFHIKYYYSGILIFYIYSCY